MVAPEAVAKFVVRGIAPLTEAESHQISWINDKKHIQALLTTRAAAVIGTEALVGHLERGIVVSDADSAIADVLDAIRIPESIPELGIHSTAVVHKSARISEAARVGAYAVIHDEVQIEDGAVIHEGVSLGRGVRVGEKSVIHDRCVVYDRCEIGRNVTIHSGTVIGADGFGYVFRKGRHRKLAHIGYVVIEDDVEIGANCCIDRGKFGATRIGRGTKIDNLVMIAHNVQIGPNCLLAAQVGISGSVHIGAGSAFGGQSGVTHGITIGNEVRVAAQSGIIGDVEDGVAVMGMPAHDKTLHLRAQLRLRELPELFMKIASLSRRVAELEAAANNPKHG